MKKLRKSSKNAEIEGVCGGVAEYLDIDVTIVRLIMVLWGLTGSGILVYIIAALVIPEDDGTDE